MTIVGGVVQPDYDACVDAPVGNTIIIEGPEGPPGPPGTSCPLFCGTGSPEGVVTSPIGGIYEQTDAASTSHSVWFKHSGVGNTGWRAWAGMRGGDGANTALRMGDSSVASGANSIAFGEAAEATGVSSIAIGKNTLASGARSEAFGEDSEATADDAKAYGVGAKANAARALAFGPLAQVDAAEGISIGDGQARSINDISIGYSHDFGAAVAHGSILIGKNASILTGADSSSSTPSLYGGHILIGEDTETPYAASQFQNTVIGFKAKARGRAVIAIGQEAEGRAANNPTTSVEGRFAAIIGYKAKGSGGCIVCIGDQADVDGDNSVAVGTHAVSKGSAAAFGPNSDAVGSSTALGHNASAVAGGGVAIGSASVAATALGAIGINGHVQAGHENTCVILGQSSTAPNQLMFGDEFAPGISVHFNSSPIPAFVIAADGSIQTNSISATPVAMPIAGDATLDVNYKTVLMDSTAAARIVNLPASASVPIGTVYTIRRETAGANNVTITPNGAETIDGAANYVLNARWKWVTLYNDGTAGFEWTVVNNN